MITHRTKMQLIAFAIITLLGVSYVGAKYARLDRLVVDDTYTVTAHYPSSGGIFAGAEVTYRGVGVGTVRSMELTRNGVDVHLDIDKDYDAIPADSLAVVGNRSAVGEQYVELQPQSDSGPYLAEGSDISPEATQVPLATDTLLTNLSRMVGSVDRDALRTTTTELGDAFEGTGRDLQSIIDSGNSFIREANANFDVTTALLRDSNTVLSTQVEQAQEIRSLTHNLDLFSTQLAASDEDLRAVIDNGSASADQLRLFLEENDVELSELINNLVTTGEVVVRRLAGVEQILVVYPYVVEGGFTVVSKSPDGQYYAHFGMITQHDPPTCHRGYGSTDRRTPHDGSNRPMNTAAHCAEPATQSNPRGAQHAPRPAPGETPPVVASYDPETGEVTWKGDAPDAGPTGTVAPETLGEESWKWLYLQPLVAPRR